MGIWVQIRWKWCRWFSSSLCVCVWTESAKKRSTRRVLWVSSGKKRKHKRCYFLFFELWKVKKEVDDFWTSRHERVNASQACYFYYHNMILGTKWNQFIFFTYLFWFVSISTIWLGFDQFCTSSIIAAAADTSCFLVYLIEKELFDSCKISLFLVMFFRLLYSVSVILCQIDRFMALYLHAEYNNHFNLDLSLKICILRYPNL